MNWYKISQMQLETLEDRNALNDKIKQLKHIGEMLDELSRMVFQNAKTAKEKNFTLANNKKMSSYPAIKNLMLEADQIVLDSPWKFSDRCIEAADLVDREISRLEREREEFSEDYMSNKLKGWHADD